MSSGQIELDELTVTSLLKIARIKKVPKLHDHKKRELLKRLKQCTYTKEDTDMIRKMNELSESLRRKSAISRRLQRNEKVTALEWGFSLVKGDIVKTETRLEEEHVTFVGKAEFIKFDGHDLILKTTELAGRSEFAGGHIRVVYLKDRDLLRDEENNVNLVPPFVN